MHRLKYLSSFLIVSFLAACGEPSAPEPRDPARSFTVQESRLADASVGFGLRLYRQVAASESKPNVMVSPLSASMALGMTMNGAEGETLDAMRTTLGYGELGEAEINEAYKGLIAQLLARDHKVTFAIANSIWHERTFAVKAPFLDAARTWFDAEVAALDFSSASAPQTISAWAERQTNGRIKDLVKEISRDEIMLLVNAVYFKAPWTSQFDPKSTRNGAFRRADGSTVSAPLMNRDGNFRSVLNQEVMAVELFYGDSAFSMIVVAPANGASLASLEAKLTTDWWNGVAASMRPGRIVLTLPKFRMSYGKTLSDPLKQLGMGIAFDDVRADFDRIADRDDLYISRVEQKTFIDVNESGTEAAAATTVGIGLTSLPPSLVFDRPFIFAIRERESGALLFIGRLGDPTAAD